MYSRSIWITLVGLACSVNAYPTVEVESRDAFPKFIPPGKGDGLNSLANHGFIPRNGKGNTIPILLKGLKDGLNVAEDFTTVIGGAGALSNPQPNPLNPSFDLDHLQKHNFPIEHDASLSRQDKFFGDNLNFNQEIWDSILAFVPEGQDFNVQNAADARYNRVQVESKRNPTFTYTPLQFILSYGETALYLQTMGSSATASTAPREYVRSMFEKERLPYELGWRKSTTPITLASLGAQVLQLNAATGEPLPEGLLLTTSTIRLAFSGLNPLTGLLPGKTA